MYFFWGTGKRCITRRDLAITIMKGIQSQVGRMSLPLFQVYMVALECFDGHEGSWVQCLFGGWWFQIRKMFSVTTLVIHDFEIETIQLFKWINFTTSYVSLWIQKIENLRQKYHTIVTNFEQIRTKLDISSFPSRGNTWGHRRMSS